MFEHLFQPVNQSFKCLKNFAKATITRLFMYCLLKFALSIDK